MTDLPIEALSNGGLQVKEGPKRALVWALFQRPFFRWQEPQENQETLTGEQEKHTALLEGAPNWRQIHSHTCQP
jgi:hypothetical protein